jgi:hypothetical protein
MNEEYVIRSPIVFQWSENNTPTPIFRGIGKLKTTLRSEIPEGGPIIKLTPVDPCDFIFGIGTVIEDICFKGPQEVAPTTHSAIMVGALVEFVIQRCWFEDFPREAFCVENRCAGGNLGDAGSIARFTLDELYALRCATKRGYTFDTGLQNTVGIIRRCVADQCGGGFHVKPSAIVMDMCSANYCTHREGFKFAAAGASLSKHPVLNSLSCEGNAAGDINLQSCAGAIINAPTHINLLMIHCINPDEKDCIEDPIKTEEKDVYGIRIGFPGFKGLGASISPKDENGLSTINVLTGEVNASIEKLDDEFHRYVRIHNAKECNNGVLPIVEYLSPTSFTVKNPNAVGEECLAKWSLSDDLGSGEVRAIISGIKHTDEDSFAIVYLATGDMDREQFIAKSNTIYCTLSGCINDANNGTFEVITINGTNRIKIKHLSAVSEHSRFTWCMGSAPSGVGASLSDPDEYNEQTVTIHNGMVGNEILKQYCYISGSSYQENTSNAAEGKFFTVEELIDEKTFKIYNPLGKAENSPDIKWRFNDGIGHGHVVTNPWFTVFDSWYRASCPVGIDIIPRSSEKKNNVCNNKIEGVIAHEFQVDHDLFDLLIDDKDEAFGSKTTFSYADGSTQPRITPWKNINEDYDLISENKNKKCSDG